MSAYIKTLKDIDENIIYPQTQSNAVYVDTTETLSGRLEVIDNTFDTKLNTNKILYGEEEPSEAPAGGEGTVYFRLISR